MFHQCILRAFYQTVFSTYSQFTASDNVEIIERSLAILEYVSTPPSLFYVAVSVFIGSKFLSVDHIPVDVMRECLEKFDIHVSREQFICGELFVLQRMGLLSFMGSVNE